MWADVPREEFNTCTTLFVVLLQENIKTCISPCYWVKDLLDQNDIILWLWMDFQDMSIKLIILVGTYWTL